MYFCFCALLLSVSFCVAGLGCVAIAYAKTMFWETKADKVQFVKWLTEKGDKNDHDGND